MATIAMTVAGKDAASPQQVKQGGASPAPTAPLQNQQGVQVPGLGTLADLRQEIDDAYDEMKQFVGMEPDQIMQICAGHTARLNEIRVLVIRVEDFIRPLKPVRTNEIEPTIKELQFQFQVASRLFAVRQLDWELVRGSGT